MDERAQRARARRMIRHRLRLHTYIFVTTVGLSAIGTIPLQAEVPYDAILHWSGPYFRSIHSPQDQVVDNPAVDIPFLNPSGAAAREHSGRDVVYVVDSGNRRIQAFEANATLQYANHLDFSFESGGVSGAGQWDGNEIQLAEFAGVPTTWIAPRSELVIIDGVTWTWVADLTGYLPADLVYHIDYATATDGPKIVFPSSSLNSATRFEIRYLVSSNQTGAADRFGIGDVDYGIGDGLSPVLAQINQSTGGPTSFQTLRSIALAPNERTSTTDDVFVIDVADNSAGLDEQLFAYTAAVDGTVTFWEAYDDSLITPSDVAIASSGACVPAAVSVSSDLGVFDQLTASVIDDGQVTGHDYAVTVSGDDVAITDVITGRVMTLSDIHSKYDNPFLGIPGVSLPDNSVGAGESITISTTRATVNRYLFVVDTGADRIKVIGAADGAGFAGNWLPGDVHQVIIQPGGNLGENANEDYSEIMPATVPPNLVRWTAAYPIAEGSLDAITFSIDGIWTRVENLSTAGPTDKVFELDWTSGRFLFGDGVQGQLPPASEDFKYSYATTPDWVRYGSSGSGPGQFDGPRGIAARWNSGLGAFDVYVADTGNHRIQKLAFYQENPSLGLPARMEYVTEWQQVASAADTLISPNDVVVAIDSAVPPKVWIAVADAGNDRVAIYQDTAAAGAGGTTAPTFDSTLGTTGTALGQYTGLEGVAFLSNGSDLDIYTTDRSRGVVTKYEEAPAPAVIVDWALSTCYPVAGAYTFEFTVGTPPVGGWIDFYFDTAATFNEVTARLALPGGSIGVIETTAPWNFADSPGGPMVAGTYYLFARLKNSAGETVASDATSIEETICLDGTIVPTLAINDAIDGDQTLYLHNSAERIIRLALHYPDKVVAAGFSATFDPDLFEVTAITQGTAWDGIGASSVLFISSFDNQTGTFDVNSSALNTPIGLTGNGPHNVAEVAVRTRTGVLDEQTRFIDSTINLQISASSMENTSGQIPSGLSILDMNVRLAYLGDLATTAAGADGTVPHLAPRPDGDINFADLMTFTAGWNGINGVRDRIADIGPAAGTIPDLASSPDREWDIDDLLVFTLMYGWRNPIGFVGSGSQDGERPQPAPLPSDLSAWREQGCWPERGLLGPGQLPPIAIHPTRIPALAGPVLHPQAPESSPGAAQAVLNLSHDAVSMGEMLEVQVTTEGAGGIGGARVWLGYDPRALQPVELIPGDLLVGAEGGFFFHSGRPGWVEITSSRLDAENPSADQDGELARVIFYALENVEPEFTLFYDLRSPRNTLLAQNGQPGEPIDLPSPALTFHESFPNPFSVTSRISFSLFGTAEVRVRVYDSGGRKIRALLDRTLGPGLHVVDFDGRDDAGRSLPGGVYYSRIESGGSGRSQKLHLVR